MLSRKFLSTLAGGIFALSMTLFVDGFFAAHSSTSPYNFVSFLPLVTGICGVIVVLTLQPAAVFARGQNDDEDVVRNKGLFFLAAILFFGAVMIGIWNAISSSSTGADLWPPVAPLLSVFALIGCGVTVFKLKQAGEEDDDFTF